MEEKNIRFDEINLHGLVSLLMKNLWVIAAVCISAILCYSSLAKLNYTPTYTSSATIEGYSFDKSDINITIQKYYQEAQPQTIPDEID